MQADHVRKMARLVEKLIPGLDAGFSHVLANNG